MNPISIESAFFQHQLRSDCDNLYLILSFIFIYGHDYATKQTPYILSYQIKERKKKEWISHLHLLPSISPSLFFFLSFFPYLSILMVIYAHHVRA